ncbi:hypothetical protein J6590_055516 [Homalodisca vitripennis]|nr:hypothetical protein J6590_055516 [Homalodisca vitripennis]
MSLSDCASSDQLKLCQGNSEEESRYNTKAARVDNRVHKLSVTQPPTQLANPLLFADGHDGRGRGRRLREKGVQMRRWPCWSQSRHLISHPPTGVHESYRISLGIHWSSSEMDLFQ